MISARSRSFWDIAILALLLAQLVLGIGTIFISLQHLDGGEMIRFMTWAQMIFTFQANAAAQIADVAPVFKLHLFLGLTIFLVFPFTRLVHMLSVPLRYITRPGYQIVRSRRRSALSKQHSGAVPTQKGERPAADTAFDLGE